MADQTTPRDPNSNVDSHTTGREINPPPNQYPKPEPVAGNRPSADEDKPGINPARKGDQQTERVVHNAEADEVIEDRVREASEESFPASDPPGRSST
jgi:hypothetical protein